MSIVKRSIDLLAAFAMLAFFAALLLSLKNPTSLDDGLRHYTMAALLREQGILSVPGWSVFFYEGYLSTLHADPWFLSNVLMIPFTYFPIADGLHLFILAEIVVLLVGCLLLLRSFSLSPVACGVFLLVIVFGDLQFLGRFLLGRPYALMTGVTLLFLWSVIQHRWIIATILLALSVLLSQLFVFPLCVGVCGLLANDGAARRVNLGRLLLVLVFGLLIGFSLHPYPLEYLSYIMTVFLKIPFLKSVGLSTEMRSSVTDLSFMSVTIAVGFAALSTLLLWSKGHRKRMMHDPGLLLLLILAALFGGAFLLWVRMIDLLWPILIFLIARLYAADASLIQMMRITLLPRQFRLRWMGAALSVLAIVHIVATPRAFLKNDPENSIYPFQALQLIPAGSRVLNLDWDRFFPYVAIRPDLKYATGIDPTFTYLTDPMVAKDLQNVYESGVTVASLQRILKAYPSDYLLVDARKSIPGHGSGAGLEKLRLMTHSGALVIYQIQDAMHP